MLHKNEEKSGNFGQIEEKVRRNSVENKQFPKKVKNLGNIDETLDALKNVSLPFLTVRQVADILGNDTKTILGWCRKNLIMAEEVPFGKKTSFKIQTQALIMFVESQKTLVETTKKQIKNHSCFVPGWIEAMKQGMIPESRGAYSAQTTMNYTLRINKYLQRYSSVTYHHVRKHLSQFPDRTSNKVQEYRALVSFSKYLFSEEALNEKNYDKITGKTIRPKGNPTPKRLRVPYEDYRTMILRGCRSLRDRVLVHILFHTGMRASEICNIQPEYLDLEKGELFIPKAKGHKQRLLGLNRTACAAFRKYLEYNPKKEGAYLFLDRKGQKMVHNGLFARIKRIARDAGLDPSKISPHAFRRSFGTFNLQKGRSVKSVQLALGHSKPSITLEIYDTTSQQEVANMMKNW